MIFFIKYYLLITKRNNMFEIKAPKKFSNKKGTIKDLVKEIKNIL